MCKNEEQSNNGRAQNGDFEEKHEGKRLDDIDTHTLFDVTNCLVQLLISCTKSFSISSISALLS